MNWGELKSAVAAWSKRSDLTAVLPVFLDLAEQRIYNGQELGGGSSIPPLRLSNMMTTISPFTGTTLPADFIEAKRVSWFLDGTVKRTLDFLPLERMSSSEGQQGRPAYFSIKGNSIVYAPTFTNNVELVYFAKFTTPSADGDTNWLLSNASAVYLWAMCIEAALWMHDDAMASRASAAFSGAMNALQAQDDGNKHSGAQLRMTSDARRLI
jgi:hypothetical protein